MGGGKLQGHASFDRRLGGQILEFVGAKKIYCSTKRDTLYKKGQETANICEICAKVSVWPWPWPCVAA
jgi:hypothetical protein